MRFLNLPRHYWRFRISVSSVLKDKIHEKHTKRTLPKSASQIEGDPSEYNQTLLKIRNMKSIEQYLKQSECRHINLM